METAVDAQPHKSTPRIWWWWYAGAAAAIAIIMVAAIIVVGKIERPQEETLTAMALPTTQKIQPSPTAPPNIEVKDEKPGEEAENKSNLTIKNKIATEKNVILTESNNPSDPLMADIEEDWHEESTKSSVSAGGAMSSRSSLAESQPGKHQLSTEDCDPYMRMMRQSYIERMRFEIAETASYVRNMRESTSESI